MSNVTRQEYRDSLVALIDLCLEEGSEEQAVIVLHTPKTRTISLMALNASEQQLKALLVSAALPYMENDEEGKVLN